MSALDHASRICERCSNLLHCPETSLAESLSERVEYRKQNVGDAAAEGCRICFLVWTFMQTDSGRSHSSPVMRFFGTRRRIIPSGPEGKRFSDKFPSLELDLLPGLGGRPPWHEGPFVMSIELSHRADIDDRPAILDTTLLISLADHEGRAVNPLRARVPIQVAPLVASTGDPRRLQTVKGWLAECQRSHPRCSSTNNASRHADLPSRLIDVSDQDRPWLVSKTEITHEAVKYATVSHRWRSESMPKLLRANYQRFRHSIDPRTLPPVFRDSIALCHQLNITYLWIDALCLIQDDPVDCEFEIGRMGSIYRHAFCNFSATAAAERSVGLFVHSDTRLHTAFSVSAEREERNFELYGYRSDILKDTDDTALQRRGWVLQERMLSPRTIFFGDQLSWECLELHANETFPEGLPGFMWGPGNFSTFKLDNVSGSWLYSNSVDKVRDFDRKTLYRLWRRIIDRYVECDLTFESDIFPALSGLARCFNEALNDTYLAGLWKGSLYNDLIWMRFCNPHLKSGWGRVQPAAYRAPSWSWASMKAPSHLFHEPGYVAKPKKLAEILDSSVTLASDDPYGQVLHGYIRTRGHLKPAQSRKSSRNLDTPLRHRSDGEWFDDGYDAELCRWTTGAFFLPMLYYTAHQYNDRQCPSKIIGLILEEVAGKDLTYKRVGLFDHLHGELCDKEVQQEWYPELADFDPDNYECQDIIII